MISIWLFHEAPEEYRSKSTNGGDEDYIAFVPKSYFENHYKIPYFLEEGTPFGCCTVERHDVEGGIILIGCHS